MKRTLTTTVILATAAIMGFDHLRFTYPISGVNQRLSNVTKPGSRVVKEILA